MASTATTARQEADRLACLSHYEVLHALQERVFSEVVELAARIFSLPIALLNVVEADLVRSGAQHGLPANVALPRAEVLCSHTVAQGQVVVYHDLAAVAPTPDTAAALQATLSQRARFYAAAPVCLSEEQHCVGTLCLFDQQPRVFTAEEQQVLERLAKLVSRTIVVRHQYSATPEQQVQWTNVHTQLHDEVRELEALVRYLLTRYGLRVPVPEDVLHLVNRRLRDLHLLMQEEA